MISMKWSWYYVAQHIVEQDYGGYVDWEEEFFECPECGERIYRCDYPYIDLGMICPVCESMIEEEER